MTKVKQCRLKLQLPNTQIALWAISRPEGGFQLHGFRKDPAAGSAVVDGAVARQHRSMAGRDLMRVISRPDRVHHRLVSRTKRGSCLGHGHAVGAGAQHRGLGSERGLATPSPDGRARDLSAPSLTIMPLDP